MTLHRVWTFIPCVLASAACFASAWEVRVQAPGMNSSDFARAWGYVERGNELDSTGHSREAIAAYAQAIALGLAGAGRRERGVAYTAAGDLSAAQADFDEAIRLEPLDVTARFDRAWLEFDK